MAKYKRKPEIVDAERWEGPGTHLDVEDAPWFTIKEDGPMGRIKGTYGSLSIYVLIGNYILTHSDGSVSVMSEKEFNEKYEKVEAKRCSYCENGIITFKVKFLDCVETRTCSECKGTGKVGN